MLLVIISLCQDGHTANRTSRCLCRWCELGSKILIVHINDIDAIDAGQSKLHAYTFEVIKVVHLSESIVSWDLEELKIIFLVNCDFLDILCSSLYNVNVEFLQILLRNLSKHKLKMSDLLHDGSTSISAFLRHAEFYLCVVQDCLV